MAARELRERWLLFPAGLALGCVPLVLPAFGVPRDAAGVGLLAAMLLGAAAAVVIGSSMLARDAANGRLGFLFSRPVAWPAIWGGKWLAAIVLVGRAASWPRSRGWPPFRWRPSAATTATPGSGRCSTDREPSSSHR